jgi:hypothetical protein
MVMKGVLAGSTLHPRLTLADSNTVLLAYYESLRLGMMRPVLTAWTMVSQLYQFKQVSGSPCGCGTERGTC